VLGVVVGPAGEISGALVESLIGNRYGRTFTDSKGMFDIAIAEEVPSTIPLFVRHPDYRIKYDPAVRTDLGQVVIELEYRAPLSLSIVDAVTQRPVDGEVSLRTLYTDEEPLLMQLHRLMHIGAIDGQVLVDICCGYLDGIQVKSPGYDTLWLPASTLPSGCAGSFTAHLQREPELTIEVLDALSGEHISDATFEVKSTASGEKLPTFTGWLMTYSDAVKGYAVPSRLLEEWDSTSVLTIRAPGHVDHRMLLPGNPGGTNRMTARMDRVP